MIQQKFLGTMPAAHRPLTPRPRGTVAPPATVAATSWTRTKAAPHAIAHTAEASEPSRRSPGPSGCTSPTRPSGDPPAPRWPRKLLRLVPTSTGTPVADELGQGGQELEVVPDRLAEPDPGIDVELLHAGSAGLVGLSQQVLGDLCDDVVVVRVELHVGRRSLAVHGDEAGAVLGRDGRQARGDVVQHASPRPTGRRGRPRPWSCRPTPGPRRRAPRRRARPGAAPRPRATALAPGRVDSPPTSTTSAPSATIWRPRRSGVSEVQVEAAVGEGVGCDVQHAHHEGEHASRVEGSDASASHMLHGFCPGPRVGAEQSPHRRGDRHASRACERPASTCTDARPRSRPARLGARAPSRSPRRSGSSSALGPGGARRRHRRHGPAWKAR